MSTSLTEDMETSSGPIIGAQYCLPNQVDLAFTRKVAGVKHGSLAITDTNGDILFWIKISSNWTIKKKLIDANSRQPLISMKEKSWSLHEEWQVFRGDSTKKKDLLFRVRRSKVFQMHTELEVFLAANSREFAKCDFKIKGKYSKRSTMIYKGDSSTVLAQMSKEHKVEKVELDKNAFGVRINPNTDMAFIVALFIIVQQLSEQETAIRNEAIGSVIGEVVAAAITS
ncbi:LURP-one-related protein [Dioscorea alata]|uniref:LURP-one-related protein n=1 Tax=Dioscorea alata TaxID=55571 RepID=A0ACB7V2V4_DIOAL|nr:LURP-one-related protein [Dioscorea alata]